jgi:hypothetical protein
MKNAFPPLAPIASAFTLTAAFGHTAVAQSGAEQPSATHRLTVPEVDKLVDAVNNLAAALERNPGMAREIPPPSGDDETLDQVSNRLEKSPQVNGALRKAGISAHQYLDTLLTVAQAHAFSVMAQDGDSKAPQDADLVANIRFVEAHQAELDRLVNAGERLHSAQIRAADRLGSPGNQNRQPSNETDTSETDVIEQ